MILGIETSGSLCSIAWYEKNKLLLEYNIEEEQVHSKVLSDLFAKGLAQLDRPVKDIEIAAIATGPGSFTGLRIGMSFIKGICYGADIPIVGVSNFNVLAWQVSHKKNPFVTLINANKGKVYYAKFENEKEEYSENGIIEIDNINQIANNQSGIVYDFYTNINDKKEPWKNFSWTKRGYYNASYLCEAANNKFLKYGSDDLNNLEPLYLQAFAGIL